MEAKQRKEKSEINLLAGKASFIDEPLWYRLIVILIIFVFLLLAMWLMREWIIPSIAASCISKLNNLVGIGRGAGRPP